SDQLNDIFVTEGTSFVDGISNTLFLAYDGGLTKLSENNASTTMGAVKYYGAASTTEEMIGDIRGMWPFEGAGSIASSTTGTVVSVADASVNAANLIAANANGSGLQYVSGVRGTAIDFDGTDDYVCTYASDTGVCDDNTNFDFTDSVTMGAWINLDAINFQIFNKYNITYGYRLYSANTTNITFGLDGIPAEAVATTRTSLNWWHHVVASYDGTAMRIYVNGVEAEFEPATGTITNSDDPLTIGVQLNNDSYGNGTLDEPFMTATVLTASQIKHMYEVGARALQNHTASNITGLTLADEYQQLYGSTSIATAVVVDEDNDLIYVGTNDGSNTGGVTAIGLYSDTIEDVWASDAWLSVTDDDNTAWNADDIVAIGITGRYPSTIAIATDAEFWIETESFSFDKYRSEAQNPPGAHLVQTALSVTNDLEAGEEFTVWGSRVLGEQAQKPTFKVAQDGTVSVREEL
ncbi:MAG: LamG domain-containing protein, partial [Anaerolineales bacterium]|nr:LamG domain-containing protein [Anaerolineales bacterium]